MQLYGSNSLFSVDSATEESLDARIAAGDISPALMLPGSGNRLQTSEALAFEDRVFRDYSAYIDALQALSVDRAYRASIARPEDLQWKWIDCDVLELRFYLDSGSYATAIVRELMNVGERENAPS